MAHVQQLLAKRRIHSNLVAQRVALEDGQLQSTPPFRGSTNDLSVMLNIFHVVLSYALGCKNVLF